MGQREEARAPHEIGFESHGVRVVVSASDGELLSRLTSWLPPGAERGSAVPDDPRFEILTDDVCGYRLKIADEPDMPCRDLDLAIGTLQRRVGGYVAAAASDRTSIHAGAVVHDGRAILVPGYSLSGKTTLVTELVRLGATFFSDEYAVLDESGLVHPFPQPMSVRIDGYGHIRRLDGDHGATGSETPAPVGLVVITSYRAGVSWNPESLTSGAGAVALLAHAIAIDERPIAALAATRRAAENALVFEGPLGEVADVAPALLDIASETLDAR